MVLSTVEVTTSFILACKSIIDNPSMSASQIIMPVGTELSGAGKTSISIELVEEQPVDTEVIRVYNVYGFVVFV